MTLIPRRVVHAALQRRLQAFESNVGCLAGLTVDRRASLIEQFVDSVRRNQFIEYLTIADLSGAALDATNANRFDPLRAAVLLHRRGEEDEALWMLFLFIHFGKHRRTGYGYARAIYGGLGEGAPWTWARISSDLPGFRRWLQARAAIISSMAGAFGNHRKYESLSGVGEVVASYVQWVGNPPLHQVLFDRILGDGANDPEIAFATLFKSMIAVHRFGRIARFDYLSMAGKIGLVDIRPDKAYLQGSSGPRKGAAMLFTPHDLSTSCSELERHVAVLRDYLDVPFDVIEDALCNWQKSPDNFRPFRG